MLLFGHHDATGYRMVAECCQHLADFRISDAQWDALQIPIGIAFFVKRAAQPGVVALYPSPAGATESLPGLAAWRDLESDNPVLAQLEPDVEALLANRIDGARAYYRVSIDHCYALAGLIRSRWQGISSGSQVRDAIREFFTALDSGGDASGKRFHA